MEVSGQLHTSATLHAEEETLIPTGQGAVVCVIPSDGLDAG